MLGGYPLVVAKFDLVLAWEWPYDAGFVSRLSARAGSWGWSVLSLTAHNLPDALQRVREGSLRVHALLDRAADARSEFLPLTPLLEERGAWIINHVHRQSAVVDKGRTHILCTAGSIPVPLTVIAPPFIFDPSPPPLPAALGRPFVAKPARGGGGEGVVMGVASVPQVQEARRTFWRQRYLLQQRICPRRLAGQRAWFRVFSVCGRVIPCWWDDQTHIYTPLTATEESRLGLGGLYAIMERIGRAVALDLFTTEIVLGGDGRLVCVDYANSPCDLRLQSEHPDGVPDEVADRIIDTLLARLAFRLQRLQAELVTVR